MYGLYCTVCIQLDLSKYKKAIKCFPRKISLFLREPKKTILRPGADFAIPKQH